MCDFSLHAVRSRPAKVGDRLSTRMFNAGTTGFCAPGPRFDVDVVELRKIGHPTIKRVRSERRSNEHPRVKILWQNQIARGGVFRQITRSILRLRAGA